MASQVGRGAQVILDGDEQKAARGVAGSSVEANAAAKRALELAGLAPDGSTADGSTRTGVAAVDEVLAPQGDDLAVASTATVLPTNGPVARSLSDIAEFARTGAAVGLAPPDSAADAIIDAMVVEPSTTIKLAIRSLVYSLRTAGIWAKLDLLYVLPVHTEQASRLNWINPGTFTATATGAMAFTPYFGWQGTGSGAINLDTGYGPDAVGGAKFTQNSAFHGVWVLGEISENKDDAGSTNVLIRSRYNGTMAFRMCSTATTTTTVRSKSAAGFTWASRTASTGYVFGKNAAQLGTVTDTSAAAGSTTLKIGSGGVAPGSTKRIAAYVVGSGLTAAEVAALYSALSPVIRLLSLDLYTVDVTAAQQTIDGIGFEMQTDSIEGDTGGILESNTSNIPLDLTSAEQVRLAQQAASLPEGGRFDNFRLAAGLYWRGVTADGKSYREKYTGQNVAIRQFCDLSGCSIAYLMWSPAPYWKAVTIGGTPYRGSTRTVPDKVADPTGWNTYLRDMLQGGALDAPDKVADPTGYAAWMMAFGNAVLADVEYVHTNLGRVTYFSPQNEPGNGTVTSISSYPFCNWTDQQFYDFLKVIVPKIRASAVLATYRGQPNPIRIYADAFNGQAGKGSALIKADPALMAELYGWAWHVIDATGSNAAWVRENASTYTAAAMGKPVFCDESEYFDPYVTVGNADYQTDAWRFANTCLMPLFWFVYVNSPIWYWIHLGKDTSGPAAERAGRALIAWRRPAAGTSTEFPNLAASSWDYVKFNWNAIRPWLRWLPKGSVRLSSTATTPRNDQHAMAWLKPDGKLVIAAVNRGSARHTFTIAASGVGGTFRGYRYSATAADVDLGVRQCTGGLEFGAPAFTAEFWVQQ